MASSNITHPPRSVPSGLRAKIISGAALEFLDYGPVNLTEEEGDEELEGKKKNHVILRVEFKDEIMEANPAAPARTKGMRLSVDTKYDPAAPQGTFGSTVKVKTVLYSGPSYNALATAPLLLSRDNITLGEFLDAALDKNLDGFYFVYNGRGFMGCRDVMVQWTYQLVEAGLIGKNIFGETVYQIFGYRYLPDRRRIAKKIDKGRFQQYQRAEVDGMPYA